MMKNKKWVVFVGNFLFKYRSYFFVPVLLALVIFTNPQMPFGSHLANNFLNIFGIIIALLGFFVRVFVIGYKKPKTSGRGTNIDVEQVVTDGMYLTCRNPLYFANFLMWLGLTIVWWEVHFFVTIVIFFAVEYFFIIKAEESYLSAKFGKVYDDYRNSVGAFFPQIKNLKKPDRPFNWEKILQNESNLFLMILLFVPLFQMYEDTLWDSGSSQKSIISLLVTFVLTIVWGMNYYRLKKGR